MFERVEQTTDANCGEAALAILLGRSLEETRKIIGRDVSEMVEGFNHDPDNPNGFHHIGLTGPEIIHALWSLNIGAGEWHARECFEGTWIERYWTAICYPLRGDMEEMIFRRHWPALIWVPSLNRENCLHIVAVAEGRMIDPARGNRYPASIDDARPLLIQAAVIVEPRSLAAYRLRTAKPAN